MSDITLGRVLTFNQELLQLSATGLPLDLGDIPSGSTQSKLERINEVLSTRVHRGQSVEQAISEESELTPQYRAALLTWLRCDDPTVALDGLAMPAIARRRLGLSIGQSMLYPLILLMLTYVGFLYLCGVTAPRIEAIYQQITQSPGGSLAFLTASRQLMSIWVPLIPLLLIATVIVWRLRVSGFVWFPGSSRYFDAIRNANMAHQLARLMEAGLSIRESVALAGPHAGMPSFAGSRTTGVSGDEDVIASLPSLLRWAVSGDLGGEPMPSVLRFVAQTYRQKAQRQETIWRVVAPTVCGILVGGAFVLCYSLSLFMPVIQLLKDVSLPGGV